MNYINSEASLRAANEVIPDKMKRKYVLYITYKERKLNMVKSISEI